MAQDEVTKVPKLVFGTDETEPAQSAPQEQAPVTGTSETPAEPAEQAPTTEQITAAASAAVAETAQMVDELAHTVSGIIADAPKAPMAPSPAAAAQAPAQAAAAAAADLGSEKPLTMEDSGLSEEELAEVEAFSKTIDIRDSGAVLQYGAGAQKHMADFSEKALEKVKTKDLGEVGDMITSLVTRLKGFDIDEKEKGIFGFFKKQANKAMVLKTRFDEAEVNVDKIVQALQAHQQQLLKDIALMDQLYQMNLTYFKELTMYILAGKKRLQEIREGELAEAIAKAEASGLAEDAQAAKDLEALCDRFEKKIHDLELTRMIALQTAPQIRLVQDSDTLMVEKIQSTIVNTIPLWKSQMLIALGVEHSAQAAKAQREVTEVTNELLKKNAERLKMATVETAKESERGVVDIETLKHTNATLISTLDEVLKIQTEGKEKRRAAEAEMARMESELKSKLIELSRK